MESQVQRWSAKQKIEPLLSLVRGEQKLVDVCAKYDLKQSEVESWMEAFLKPGERGPKVNAGFRLARFTFYYQPEDPAEPVIDAARRK